MLMEQWLYDAHALSDKMLMGQTDLNCADLEINYL